MFGHFSSAVLVFLMLNGFQSVIVSAYKCVECASLALRDTWQLTSYPVMYDDEKFIPHCDDAGVSAKVVDCQSLCIEMIIPTSNSYAMLRGCLQNLLGSNYRSNATITNSTSPAGDCSYGPIDNDRKVGIRVGNTIIWDTAFIGIHFCTSGEQLTAVKKLCNSKMTLSAMTDQYEDGGRKATGFFDTLDFECPLASSSAVNCIDCLSIDDNGACDKDTTKTCAGSYCSKTYGKEGLTKFSRRGCFPINPYGLGTDGCTRINIKSNTLMSDGIAGTAPRTKRGSDLSLTYEVDQCFCTKSKCNGATSLTFAFISFVSPTLIAVRIL